MKVNVNLGSRVVECDVRRQAYKGNVVNFCFLLRDMGAPKTFMTEATRREAKVVQYVIMDDANFAKRTGAGAELLIN